MEDIKKAARQLIENLSQKDIDKSLALFPAFSDFKIAVAEQTVEGLTVKSRWVLTGVHTGEFLGIPASGKKIFLGGVAIHQVQKCKIVENSFEIDFNKLIDDLTS